MLTIICAIAQNRGIGYNNNLLFHLSADLKRFKSLTTEHTIIMGRRTFDSLPKGALPNRRNIVLSRNASLQLPGAEVFPSLQAALNACQTNEDVYIIGGASVYAEAFPLAQRLCLRCRPFLPKLMYSFPNSMLRNGKKPVENITMPMSATPYRSTLSTMSEKVNKQSKNSYLLPFH